MDRIVLVTGANRGLGFEFVRQLIHQGNRVVAAARKTSHELMALVKDYPNLCEFHTLDVTRAESLQDLSTLVQKLPHLDWVIANAGIMGPAVTNSLEATYEDYENVFKTNVVGPLEVAKVCFPKLKQSKTPVFASLSSLMGSIQDNSSAGYGPYRVSKTALNMLNKNLAIENPEINCLVLHPGWVQTDMGGIKAPLKAPQSVEGMLKVLEAVSLQKSGTFVDYRGKELPW
jgi:NAD(P)-dependent dehydrogenase (short-subunit alcohol dehydrogenase family)